MTDLSTLQQQRVHDLQLAAASTNPAGAAHDRAQAAALSTEIKSGQTAAATAASTAASTAATTATTDAANQATATASIGSTLASLGLGTMTTWATNLASTLAGQGIDSSDIVNTVIGELNNPTDANGQVDAGALAAFNAALPGFNQLIANTGQNGSPGSTPAQAIAQYVSYSAQVQAFATQAGLVPGTISAQDIGDLWAGQVSSTEVSDRITEAASNANMAMSNANIGTYLQSQGLTASSLASYYINPTNTMAQLNAVNSGVAGAATGFGQMSAAQSQSLAAFLSPASSSGVSAVTTQQAMTALTSNLASGTSSAAGMVNAGFENALPGQPQGGPGVISGNQLLGAVEGNAQDVAAARLATGTRAAGTAGGGGAVNNAQGVQGVGFGSAD